MAMKAAQWSLLGGSALLAGLAAVRFALALGGTAVPDLPALVGGSYEAQAPRPLDTREAVWNEPPAQSGGEDWVFEVFTPPIIYFNPETKEFTLTPPVPRAQRPPFGLEVVSVERELYRLQYAGYLGEEGRYLVEVRDLASGQFLRGRVGDTFEEAAFSIRDFAANRRLVEPENPGETPYVETEIRLTIHDARLGEDLVLTDQPRYGERPIVTAKSVSGQVVTAFPGDVITLEGARYHIRSANPATGEATIEKVDADGSSLETRSFETKPPPR
jgi:hypothetical protein